MWALFQLRSLLWGAHEHYSTNVVGRWDASFVQGNKLVGGALESSLD